MVGTKRREMGLGAYPGVTLADARRRARELRETVDKGIDPLAQRQAAKQDLRATQQREMTFKKAAELYIEAREPSWRNPKHAQQWENTLASYAYPVIGDKDCATLAWPT